MRNIIILAIALFAAQVSIAQSKLVKYFSKLPAEYKQPVSDFTIKEKAGKVTASSASGPCGVKHDAVNGYMQVIDDGTGGGQFVYEMAIFKTKDGKDLVASNAYSQSADGNEEVITHFFYSDGMRFCNGAVWPDLGFMSAYLPKGVTNADIEPYSDSEYAYNVLPQKGTTILRYFGYKKLDEAAANGDEKAAAIAKKLKANPLKLTWNKAKGYFEY